MRQRIATQSWFALCLSVGASAALAAPPGNGAELAQLCIKAAEPCTGFILGIAKSSGDDKTICLPNDYRPEHLRDAYIEWAAASDADLLARASAEQAVLAAFRELYSCDE
jgi:hypothetical protein